MRSTATTVIEYLAELPKERREAIGAIRRTILKNLPRGYEEVMQYGMIGYVVPHSLYPPGYHCDPKQPLPYACLASQKNYMSLYLFSIYCDKADGGWFRDAWMKAGKKLDAGKSCVRFKSLDDVPLAVVGQAIKRTPVKKFIRLYEAAIQAGELTRRQRLAEKKRLPVNAASKSAATKTPAARQRQPRKKS